MPAIASLVAFLLATLFGHLPAATSRVAFTLRISRLLGELLTSGVPLRPGTAATALLRAFPSHRHLAKSADEALALSQSFDAIVRPALSAIRNAEDGIVGVDSAPVETSHFVTLSFGDLANAFIAARDRQAAKFVMVDGHLREVVDVDGALELLLALQRGPACFFLRLDKPVPGVTVTRPAHVTADASPCWLLVTEEGYDPTLVSPLLTTAQSIGVAGF